VRGIDGVILVDKPTGCSSHAIVDRVRRSLLEIQPGLAVRRRRRGRRDRGPRFKCGHAGTLDPLATGLLVVLVGAGVRLSRFLMGLDKRYRVVCGFGVETDSLDADGKVTATVPVSFLPADLAAELARFRGSIRQVPPLISALKQDGIPLYKRVRSGRAVKTPAARPVSISTLELVDTDWGVADGTAPENVAGLLAADGCRYDATLTIECSSGTYVRALARDLAVALGTVGFVRQLRREAVGPFTIADALPADALDDGEALLAAMRPLSRSLPHLPLLTVDRSQAASLRQGGQPQRNWFGDEIDNQAAGDPDDEVWFRIVDPAEDLVAVGGYSARNEAVRTVAVFPGRTEE